MAVVKHRRMPTKLRIEQHTITIHYLGEKTTTTFTAAQLVPPGELRRYRQSKGRFCLSFKLLIARLNQICGDFNEVKHAVVYAQSPKFAAKILTDEKGFNAAFREQIARFRKMEGGGTAVFWAVRRSHLNVRGLDLSRDSYLAEAGVDIAKEDGEWSTEQRREVEAWSEAVAKEAAAEDGVESDKQRRKVEAWSEAVAKDVAAEVGVESDKQCQVVGLWHKAVEVGFQLQQRIALS